MSISYVHKVPGLQPRIKREHGCPLKMYKGYKIRNEQINIKHDIIK
jgi:hypothetical protein